jgi:hypothetical protein
MRFRRPLIVLAISIIILTTSYVIIYLFGKDALNIEIPTKSEKIISPPFHTMHRRTYEIEIEFDRKLPYEQMICLLGEEEPQVNDCHDIKSVVALRWELIHRDSTLASGITRDHMGLGVSKYSMSKTIYSFTGDQNKEYRLNIKIMKDISALYICKQELL